MIDQRTKDRAFASLCARAHASVRPFSILHVLWADIQLSFATRSNPTVVEATAPCPHDRWQRYVCFDQSPLYNPHRQPSLLQPNALVQRVFILNALDSNRSRPIASARIQVKTYPISSIPGAVLCFCVSDEFHTTKPWQSVPIIGGSADCSAEVQMPYLSR